MTRHKKSDWAGVPIVMGLAIIAVLMTVFALYVTSADDWLAMRTLPECVTEDQTQPDCAWHAKNHGNGTGQDFYVRNGRVIYP